MLDIKFIRENTNLVKEGAEKKGIKLDIERLLVVDKERRKLQVKVDQLRKKKRELAGAYHKQQKKDLTQARFIKSELLKKEKTLKELQAEFDRLMLAVPNIPDSDLPIGKREEDNKVIRQYGQKPRFKFRALDHVALGEELDIIDFKKGAAVSGSGFYYLKNEGAILEWSLLRFTIDELIKRGFIFMNTPTLVREEAMIGTGFFPRDRREVYSIEKDKLFLIGTAEVTLGAYYKNTIFEKKELPKKLAAFSLCYRREAGAYGADTRGAYRVHQFSKIEMFIISKPEESKKHHEEIVAISEDIMQKLGLHYRVTLNCTGDLGVPQARKYDIQAWMPGRNAYGETHSASNDTDFQARRLEIKYRCENEHRPCFVHTLNNTAIASPRILVALLENYQEKDGSITIPKALQPYTGFSKIKSKKS